MALIIEDGTAVDGANSYGTVAEADSHFVDRNILNWAGEGATEADKEGYLIEAADYLNQFFSWRGEPLSYTQGMGLPTLAFDFIPANVKIAQFMLARERAVGGPLSQALGERLVTSERKKLDGVGEKDIQYERSRVDQFGRIGSSIFSLLRPYVRESSTIQQARVYYA